MDSQVEGTQWKYSDFLMLGKTKDQLSDIIEKAWKHV